MANRDALRELQARLAERLQRSRTEQRVPSWLAVECAGTGLLVPLAGAGEIFPAGHVLPVPHTQPWFLGVANLRGGLHGVVDLAAFLGLRAVTPAAQRDHAHLLALNASLGVSAALLIDRLAGLRSGEQIIAEPASPAGPRPGFAGAAFRDTEGRRWQEIDLAALARHEQFLGIAA